MLSFSPHCFLFHFPRLRRDIRQAGSCPGASRLSNRRERTGEGKIRWLESRGLHERPAARHKTRATARLVGPLRETQHPEPIWPHIKRPGHGSRGDPTCQPAPPSQIGCEDFRQDCTCKVGVSSFPSSPPPIPFRFGHVSRASRHASTSQPARDLARSEL